MHISGMVMPVAKNIHPLGRSIVTNGRDLFWTKRHHATGRGRRFRDLLQNYVKLAGKSKIELCRQLAILEVMREELEEKLIHGEVNDANDLMRLSHFILRTQSALGLIKDEPAPSPPTFASDHGDSS